MSDHAFTPPGTGAAGSAIVAARAQGADRSEVATGEDDRVAPSLYERSGFSKGQGAATTSFYERQLDQAAR